MWNLDLFSVSPYTRVMQRVSLLISLGLLLCYICTWQPLASCILISRILLPQCPNECVRPPVSPTPLSCEFVSVHTAQHLCSPLPASNVTGRHNQCSCASDACMRLPDRQETGMVRSGHSLSSPLLLATKAGCTFHPHSHLRAPAAPAAAPTPASSAISLLPLAPLEAAPAAAAATAAAPPPASAAAPAAALEPHCVLRLLANLQRAGSCDGRA